MRPNVYHQTPTLNKHSKLSVEKLCKKILNKNVIRNCVEVIEKAKEMAKNFIRKKYESKIVVVEVILANTKGK